MKNSLFKLISCKDKIKKIYIYDKFESQVYGVIFVLYDRSDFSSIDASLILKMDFFSSSKWQGMAPWLGLRRMGYLLWLCCIWYWYKDSNTRGIWHQWWVLFFQISQIYIFHTFINTQIILLQFYYSHGNVSLHNHFELVMLYICLSVHADILPSVLSVLICLFVNNLVIMCKIWHRKY